MIFTEALETFRLNSFYASAHINTIQVVYRLPQLNEVQSLCKVSKHTS